MWCKIIILTGFLISSLTTAASDYKAVDELDLTKYVGKWYEVYQDRFNYYNSRI